MLSDIPIYGAGESCLPPAGVQGKPPSPLIAWLQSFDTSPNYWMNVYEVMETVSMVMIVKNRKVA